MMHEALCTTVAMLETRNGSIMRQKEEEGGTANCGLDSNAGIILGRVFKGVAHACLEWKGGDYH